MGLLRTLFKGWEGEMTTRLAGWLQLDKKVYRPVHNVTLELEDGTTQIDTVLISRYGIFVVEAKNYEGWIFGKEKDKNWTQMLGRSKFWFQNPLRQNYRHICGLCEVLELPKEVFHSVVVFWGESKFKTPMPPNVLDRGYASYIKSHQKLIFTDAEVEAIETKLQEVRLRPGFATHRKHVKSLRERHSA